MKYDLEKIIKLNSKEINKIINEEKEDNIIIYKDYEIRKFNDSSIDIKYGNELITIYKNFSQISYKLEINNKFLRIGFQYCENNVLYFFSNNTNIKNIEINLIKEENLIKCKEYFDIIEIEKDEQVPHVLYDIKNEGLLFNLFSNKINTEIKKRNFKLTKNKMRK